MAAQMQFGRMQAQVEALLSEAGQLLCELVEGDQDGAEQALLAGKLSDWFHVFHGLRERRAELSVACLALIKSGACAPRSSDPVPDGGTRGGQHVCHEACPARGLLWWRACHIGVSDSAHSLRGPPWPPSVRAWMRCRAPVVLAWGVDTQQRGAWMRPRLPAIHSPPAAPPPPPFPRVRCAPQASPRS